MLTALPKGLQTKVTSYFTIKKNTELSGFTLIEILVVVAIMAILTGGAIVAYNNFNQSQTVKRAALQVKTDLRESQNRAVSGLKHDDCRVDDVNELDQSGGDKIDDFNLVGHFVTFDESTIPVGTNQSYKSAQACKENPDQAVAATGTFTAGSVEDIYFPGDAGDVRIESVRLIYADDAECNALGDGELTINFKPLKGVEFRDGLDVTSPIAANSCPRAEVVVTDGSTSFEIEVDLSGQVSEKKL